MVLFCVSCRDPGLMERVTDEEAAADGWYWNEQVGSYRPAAAMYCRECKVSRNEYIHHRPRHKSFRKRSLNTKPILHPVLRRWCMNMIMFVHGLELR